MIFNINSTRGHTGSLLVHYYNSRCKCSKRAPMIMSSPVKERAVIDIRATVESHSHIALSPGLSGADAVASFHSWHARRGCQSCRDGVFPNFLHW